MREAHTTKRPSLSRISGLAPASLPVIFSRMVVFPAFRRPMISTRNRLHNRPRSLDERSMLVRFTKQKGRSNDWLGADFKLRKKEVYKVESEVRREVQMLSINLITLAKYSISTTTDTRTRKPMQGVMEYQVSHSYVWLHCLCQCLTSFGSAVGSR